jgi:polysaccharide pyruvyl transferase WcaK-like protein
MLAKLLRARPSFTDTALEASMAAAIEAARIRHAISDSEARWTPGQRLKLLLVGYLGTRNTGADVRVSEMLRQFRTILGDDRLELSVLTSDARLSAGYFPGVRQIKQSELFPTFLYRETAKHHGVIGCEGSMFKSKFANALTTLMVGALGLASAQNKLSIGYGAEAGDMDPVLRALVTRYCSESLIVVRNQESARILKELGVPTAPGTDTAWTFEPAPDAEGQALLRRGGWDGKAPVLLVCPINPFWWPVRPEPGRALVQRMTGSESDTHYRSLYYHSYDEADRGKFLRYLEALAGAIARFAKERDVFVGVVGMERLDAEACARLSELLADQLPSQGAPPCFVSDAHDMYELVSLLRQSRYLVTSRYHAMVCSMPAGVPSLGVSMDERIQNLMADRDQSDLCFSTGDPALEERVFEGLRVLDRNGDESTQRIRASLPVHLEAMGRMGISFEDRLLERYPEFPKRDAPRRWSAYLPPLPRALSETLEAS